MSRQGLEIFVVVKQWHAVLDAPSADQQVDGLADGDPAPAQGTEITGRRDGDRVADHRHNCKTAQQGLDFLRRPLAVKALQHFAKHQIPDQDLAGAQDRAQSLNARRISAIEEFDPDAAVDDDHPAPRPLRLRARLPRQRYLPKAPSTSCCRRSLTIKRSASSTVCFLVACPEALWASAISVSSISILVRIGDPSATVCVCYHDTIHITFPQ